jgi:hypothetical protein
MICAALVVLVGVVAGVSNDKREEKKASIPLESRGAVACPTSKSSEFSDELFDSLHFCVYENGAHDLIYVGIRHGMWSQGEFDLSFKGKVVYTGKIKHLLSEGTIIDMGDVIAAIRFDNGDVKVTRVTGWSK